MLIIEPDRGRSGLDQYSAKLAPPLREEFRSQAEFHRRCFASHAIEKDEFILRLECISAEIKLKQPEPRR